MIGSDLQIQAKLGEGSFAEVFKVKSVRTGAVFAVKRLKKRYRSFKEANELPEIVSLQALRGHPNIVALRDVMFDNTNGYVAMVFEMMDSNLYEYVSERREPISEPMALLCTYQLLKAVDSMHEKGIFHRDIKPENCMINKGTFEVKLVDFGSTRTDTTALPYTEYVSTRWYRAPECILTSGSYGREVDIWALGCMLYEMVTTRPLFPGKNEVDQISRIHNVVGSPSNEILQQFRANPNNQISFAFPARKSQDFRRIMPGVSSATADFVKRSLTYNPRDRITSSEAIAHPCFAEFRAADEQWQASGMNVPFSVFVRTQFNGAGSTPSVPPPEPNRPKYQPPNAQILQQHPHPNANANAHMHQPVVKPTVGVLQTQAKPKPVIHMVQDHGKQPAYKPVVAAGYHYQGGNPSQAPQQSGAPFMSTHLKVNQSKPAGPGLIIAPKPPPTKVPAVSDLQESRKKAIARIREYNKKKYGKGPVYKKPAVEIVRPRLPHLKPAFH